MNRTCQGVSPACDYRRDQPPEMNLLPDGSGLMPMSLIRLDPLQGLFLSVVGSQKRMGMRNVIARAGGPG
jgi:hypothetical protein